MGKFKNILVRTISDISHGEFLLRLNIGRYFIHILYLIVVFTLTIWISLMIDTTMTEVEKNKAIIREQEIEMSVLEFKLAEMESRIVVEQKLDDMESKLKQPSKPAKRLK